MESYTILSGETFIVQANSSDEALAKFFVSEGHQSADDYEGQGFDFSNLADEVESGETLTEVM